MPRAQETPGASVVDLDSRRQERDRRQTVASTRPREGAPGWLLRSPAYRAVESLAPWTGIADGGSFAALLGDPIDAHLMLTGFPPHALARSFCGGPTLGQVGLAITRAPRTIKARVWVGGFGSPDEGVSVVAVYVRFEGAPSDDDLRAGRHPALWSWLVDRLGYDRDEPRWPEPDEITSDDTDVREPGSWWRLRWGPSRTPYALPRRP
jgi:hypothetical protein